MISDTYYVMGVKRKADQAEPVRNFTAKGKTSAPPSKKPRKDEATSERRPHQSTATSKPATARTQPVSLIQEEERSFSRGGGGVLTPLEHKQIQIQATKDALFEESGQKPSTGAEEVLGDDEIDGTENEPPAQGFSTKRKKKVKGTQQPAKDAVEQRIRVEGLKFKRLTSDSQVLGQISKINTNELVLDLPNSLTGRVSIANISPILNEKLNALGQQEQEGEDEDLDPLADIELERLFRVGQYLRAHVLSTIGDSHEPSSKGKKRIELSIDPRHTNAGLEPADVRVSCMLQASVASVEDHGLIMHLGFQDSTVKGFMSSKEIPSGLEYSQLREGAVFMCLVTGLSSNGKVVKLSANHERAGDLQKGKMLSDPSTVQALLPGTAIELLVSQISSSSVAGHLMGTTEAGADVVHSGAVVQKADLETKYKVGDRIKARILFNLSEAEKPYVGLTLADHSMFLKQPDTSKQRPIGTIVEKARIIDVEPGLGVFAELGAKSAPLFIHVSKMSDERVEAPSQTTGPYRTGTTHRARIIGYNVIDGVYLASFEKSVLEQEYLRIEDVPVGNVVKGTIGRLIFQKSGTSGLIVNLAKGISGLVPEIHLADIQLQNPERKFKEGMAVTARVLSTDTERHQIRLTLKKSLVNADKKLWQSYRDIEPGQEAVGTILTLDTKGALMQFFGNVRGFLPTSEMSDTFLDDPRGRFRIGQVITVRAVAVYPEQERMTVSCKSARSDQESFSAATTGLKPGNIVESSVLEKVEDGVTLQLQSPSVKATLPLLHLSDGSKKKCESALKQIRPGQTLHDLVIIEVMPKRQAIVVSNKPSLIKTAKAGDVKTKLDQLDDGMQLDGFVRNVIGDGIFMQTVGALTGFIHKSQISPEKLQLPDFGVLKGSSISARVISIDLEQQRFSLSMRPIDPPKPQEPASKVARSVAVPAVTNPVDQTARTLDDFAIGKTTQAKVISVKDTQLNVQIADKVQGRIDVSEVFAEWNDIRDRKRPLKSFKAQDKLDVRILGIHDARNHRFLPITHRGGKTPVFELSAKTQPNQSMLSYDQLATDSWHIAFVNNITDSALWVNLSPNVRGRIQRMDVSEDVSIVSDLPSHYPIGSAIRVRVKSIDLTTNRLDLTAKATSTDEAMTMDKLSEGMVLAGRITKVTERSLLIQLGPSVVGQVGLTDLADDFDEANLLKHQKNDVVRVCVLSIDRANKRVQLSTRASKVLSSALAVKDRQITDYAQLKLNDLVRGFVKNVAASGLFVALSHNITAFVPVPELSDEFVKDWKSLFEVDRLIAGKVISVDAEAKQVKLSLKESVVSGNFVPKLGFNDFHKDQIVTGRVRKVEAFGAFIVIDGSNNVSGLAHRSQVAGRRVEDVRDLYDEGDEVKAKILKIDPKKQQISFGLKQSYFKNNEEDMDDESEPEDEDEDDEMEEDGGAMLEAASDEETDEELEDQLDDDADDADSEGGIDLDVPTTDADPTSPAAHSHTQIDPPSSDEEGLDAGAFDWTGTLPRDTTSLPPSTTTKATTPNGKPRANQPYQEDLTATLSTTDTHPQSTGDFERHLLTTGSTASTTWITYISHHLSTSNLPLALQTAERALASIHIRHQDAKLEVWLAYLGLEIEHGSEETFEDVFARACEMSDAKVVHRKVADAFAASGRVKKADETFAAMLRKKEWSADVEVWLSYARFLFDGAGEPERARALLARADQSLVQPNATKEWKAKVRRELVMKFAMLEFRCGNGVAERGRNQFEELVGMYPRRWDVWDVYVWMEKKFGGGQGEGEQSQVEQRERVRDLYERMTGLKMKKRRATFAFKQWLKWEEEQGGNERKRVDHVKAKAADVADKLRAEKDDADD